VMRRVLLAGFVPSCWSLLNEKSGTQTQLIQIK
jgi:hypothetical protein